MRLITPLILSAAFLTGCMGPTTPQHYARPWLNDPRLEEWEVLDGFKKKVNRDGVQPIMQEQEGCGTMFVWNHRLSGGPGWEFLRASYTYKNTSDSNFDIVRVWIDILDKEGRLVSREEDVLIHPLGFAMTPGDTWSDVLRVPTKGAHQKEGWSWRIGCEPIHMKVLPPKRYGER